MTGIDLGQVAAIGGPFSIVGIIATILINAYLSIRKDRREGKGADISNSGAMADSAKKVMDLVNDATDRMNRRLVEVEDANRCLSESNRALESHINKQDDTIARLSRENEFLREDLARAHSRIGHLERLNGRSTA